MYRLLIPLLLPLLLLLWGGRLLPVADASNTYCVACSPGGAGDVGALKEAIDLANLNPGHDTIRITSFSGDCTFTINFAHDDYGAGNVGLPLIEDALTIDGGGATIQRSATLASHFRLLQSTAPLKVVDLTLRNGEDNPRMNGGAIYSSAPLTVSGSTLLDNSGFSGGAIFGTQAIYLSRSALIANRAFCGGAVWTEGDLVIDDVKFYDNQASSLSCGGGAVGVEGDLIAAGLTISRNVTSATGGGVLVEGAATIADAEFIENESDDGGGAIYATGALTLTNSLIAGNSADREGAGVYVGANIVVTGTTFNRNAGSAIVSYGEKFAIAASGFFSHSDTALRSYKNAFGSIVDSTFAFNASPTHPAAISFRGEIELYRNQIRANQGFGGAILADAATAVDNLFIDNVVLNDTYARGGTLTLEDYGHLHNNIFKNNRSDKAAGAVWIMHLSITAGSSTILNNLFVDNSAQTAASVLLGANLPDIPIGHVELLHNTFVSNGAEEAAAVELLSGTLTAHNNIVANHFIGFARAGDSSVSAGHNLFFETQIPYSGAVGDANDLLADPLFVDSAGGDFRLAPNSPAIDSGTATGIAVDLDGTVRPQGSGHDRGAYEHVPQIVTSVELRASGATAAGDAASARLLLLVAALCVLSAVALSGRNAADSAHAQPLS